MRSQSHVSFKRNQVHHRSGMHIVLCCNITLKECTGLAQSAQQLISSRLELKITEKIRVKIQEDIQTTRIEMTTSFSVVADEKKSSSLMQTLRLIQENSTFSEKNKQGKMLKNANEEPPSPKTSVKEFTKINGNTMTYSLNGIETNARILVDLGLKNLNLNLLGQLFYEVLLTTKTRYKH